MSERTTGFMLHSVPRYTTPCRQLENRHVAYAGRIHEHVLTQDTAVARLGEPLASQNAEEGRLARCALGWN